MAKPLDRPRRKPIIRLLSVVVAPTAASIFSPRNVPTILVSTILYVSCKRFARNTGNANDNIRTDGFPFVRSFIIQLFLTLIIFYIQDIIVHNITQLK